MAVVRVVPASGSGSARRGLAVLVAVVLASGAPRAEEATPADPDPATSPVSDVDAEEPTYLETPLFPGLRVSDALRVHFSSFFAPNAALDEGHVSLYQPELRARLTLPLTERAVVRVTTRGSVSRYEFDGGQSLAFSGTGTGQPFATLGEALDLYRARLGVEGAYKLNPAGSSLWVDGEKWAALGEVFGESRWEDGDFDDGIGGGIALGFGYEIESRLRIALGATLRTSVEEGGIRLGPLVSIRWNVTDAITLRSRGLGVQAEYRVGPGVEVYATLYRATESFQLRDRTGVFDDLRFEDRQLVAGAGFEWKLSKHLRLNCELGSIARRRIRVKGDDLGTLASSDADPSVYLDVRAGVRF